MLITPHLYTEMATTVVSFTTVKPLISRTLVSNKIVVNSDVVGASRWNYQPMPFFALKLGMDE